MVENLFSFFSKGGAGALAQECVSLYPDCTVTIFDLPKVIQTAKKHFVPLEKHRINFYEGWCSYFGERGNAFLMKYFLSSL